MRFFAWFGVFLAALLLEMAVLPQFFGALAPSLTLAVLIPGIASQRFWPGFGFAAAAGLALDVVAGGGIHTLVAIGTFFSMQAFRALTQWEEPLDRIGAVACGLILQPLLQFVGAHVADSVFGAAAVPLSVSDIASVSYLREISFAAGWFMLFVWFEIRRVRRYRAGRLMHL
ncbi:MAG: hypothetical protein HY474_01110 [Candidatus Sungbacteria bacterium]|uniref:Rod shape-determining protein MreD n=1 Tax=Candidatus Sungiibacteriota bacterium TaxID=2750080 RepID=A0A933DT14_9BACT|nr:hypothetical protein [Candidatus Sungbacteria bacterium]